MCDFTIVCKSLVGVIHMKEKMAHFVWLAEPKISLEFPMEDRWTWEYKAQYSGEYLLIKKKS